MPNDSAGEIRLILPDAARSVAHVSEYFGPWAMHAPTFRAAVERVSRIDLHAHISAGLDLQAAAAPMAAIRGDYETTKQGVAVIELAGPLMKFASSFSGGTSTVRARRALRAAVNDPDVSAILLRLDSPGGTVSGTKDLADDVAAAAAKKPLYAYAEDLCASAAYWVASQAHKVFANATALVGSIGTYGVIEDFSEAAGKLGIKVHVLSTGPYKGATVEGVAITPETLAECQRIVNELNSHFLAGVSAGRKMSLDAVKNLADGRVHVGTAAAALGLIDGVQTFEQTLSQLTNLTLRSKKPMAENTDTTPRCATFGELKAACPGADNDFLVSQLEAEATAEKASRTWMAEQSKRLDAATKQIAEAKAEAAAEKAAAKKPGVPPLAGGKPPAAGASDAEEAGDDPVAAFNAAIQKRMAAGMDRRKAVCTVAAAQPALHKQFLLATNPKRKQRALIEDRFDDE